MQKLLILFVAVFFLTNCDKKDEVPPGDDPVGNLLYFPPTGSATWENLTVQEAGFASGVLTDLDAFLEQSNTRAFIVLKNGKIVLEKYFGKDQMGNTFGASSFWYWASAGKTLTAFLVGKAQEEGFLKLTDRSSLYLGSGWTSLTPSQENAITVWHQLTMTTGMNDNVSDKDCTTPNCLGYLTTPGSRWAYHNAPYTLLDGVITGSTKQTFDNYFNSRLKNKVGMDGFWLYIDFNHIYFSTARSMARFGLLMLNKGKWDQETVLSDQKYFNEMIQTSQNLNLSYGYLWWLNGKSSFMAPGLQTVFPLSLTPNAPADMFSALGKNGQILNVIPSKNLVIVRLGDAPDNNAVPVDYVNELWAKLKIIIN